MVYLDKCAGCTWKTCTFYHCRGGGIGGVFYKRQDKLVSRIVQVYYIAVDFLSAHWEGLISLSIIVFLSISLLSSISFSSCIMLLLLSRFSPVRLCATSETAAHRAPRPWDSPGKNTGVGCHFLLQCMKVKSESEVAQSCPTLSDPMDCSLPGSSIHGIFQARVLEWGAIAFSVHVL